MKMKAPEGVSSAAVENDQYEVAEDGTIQIDNGEHIAPLEAHGFVQVPDADSDTASEPVDEIGDCPDFSKFVSRQALVDWLVAHEHPGASASDRRADLEALCVEHFGLVKAGEAKRIHPEGSEEPEGESAPEGGEQPEDGEGAGEGENE